MHLRRKLLATLFASAVGAFAAPAGAAIGGSVGTAAASTAYPNPAYGNRYYMADSSGAVWPLGGASDYGSLVGRPPARPVVGISVTPDGGGYWLVGSDGGVFTFGDARFYGSTGAVPLAKPIVAMAPTPDGKGYWLVASDGGIFAYGDARFYGSMSGSGRTVVQVVADPLGGGYWEVDHEGDVFPFGAAAKAPVPTVALLHQILGPGDVAMEWAMAQLGKPYAWGGTGPDSFDCSGLVMKAWAAAGVTIPRVAADQYDFGTLVPASDLRIGDLVFWASNPADPSTIGHVAMYIGGDHMVHAPYTGTVVQTDWVGGSGLVQLGSLP